MDRATQTVDAYGISHRYNPINDVVGRSAIRGHAVTARDLYMLLAEKEIFDEKKGDKINVLPQCAGDLNEIVLEQYLDLICDFHNTRPHSRTAGDLARQLGQPYPLTTNSPRTSERIENQRKNTNFYLFQTHEFAEILFNPDHKPGLEWGNTAVSARWKEIYP